MGEKNSIPANMPMRGRHGGPNRGMPVEKPKNTKDTLIKLWKYIKIHSFKLVLIFIFVISATLINLYGTRTIGLTIDEYILPGKFHELFRVIVKLFVMYVGAAFLTWAQTQLSVNLAQNTVYSLRMDLFKKLQYLPLQYFDTTSRGDTMSRITNDVDNISNTLNTSLSQIVSSICTITGILGFMLYLSPLLTVVSLITIPIFLTITKFITKKSKIYFKQQQKILGELNGHIEESIGGQKVIKVFVKEKDIMKQLEVSNQALKDIGVLAQVFSGIIGPVSSFINNLSYGCIAVVGAVFSIPLGIITSFLLYSRQFSRPINEIATQYNSILSAIAGAERIFEIMEMETEPADKENAIELDNIKGRVVFENVNFAYEKNHPILKNINLYANPGQTIALVGPTGAGKTTIINLLTRFYDIQSGTISIDGTNITDIKRNSLRSSLGIVLQDTFMFSGTIMENIRYGRLDATDDEVIQAAKLANAHEFIRRLNNGYNTEISEDSDTLSQGQKQMLAIARTILANPKILILDEATSNVDTRTEIKIQAAMLNLMRGRTSFVIAHRLSTIRNADLIAVIKDGEIIERGNHHELIEKQGFYYTLYMNQFAEN